MAWRRPSEDTSGIVSAEGPLILAGAVALVGIPFFGREVGLLRAILMVSFGILMILAPRFRRILLNWKTGKIVIIRDLRPQDDPKKGFDDVQED